MNLKELKKLSYAEIVHYYSGDDIITSKFNKIRVCYKNYNCSISLPVSHLEKLLGFFRLSRRALRLDKCNVFVSKNKLVLIRRGKVYCYNLDTNILKETLVLKNCRNILHQSLSSNSKGHLFFGEYGDNRARRPVNVYKSIDNGKSWQVIYQFKAGEIKHIHGCYYDNYEDKIWTLTGDFENENIIMKSDENFIYNKKIGDKSQKYRAVNLFFKKESIHWIMDSPIEKSYHYVMNRETFEIKRKSLFPGPVWYIKELSDGYFIAATSVEKGDGVLNNNACLFVSKDLEKWDLIAEFKKDFLPMRYFKWGVIGMADGRQTSKSFALHFEALKKVDGQSYIYELNEG